MPYQGARAHPDATEGGRIYAVSKVRLDSDGQVTRVLWSEVSAASNLDVGAQVPAQLAEVLDALHAGHDVVARFASQHPHVPQRALRVVEHADGRESLALAGPSVSGGEIADIAKMNN
jgi:hypothetical protein